VYEIVVGEGVCAIMKAEKHMSRGYYIIHVKSQETKAVSALCIGTV
jgi:hypothetical protein